MDCAQAIERLPWLLNGTLPAEERRAVEAHVAGCASCSLAFADTRGAWEVFAQHVPTADLVAYAADEPTGVARETLERHLAGCPQCATELEMARASRALAEHDDVAVLPVGPPGRRRGSRLWQSSALAASLVGIVAIGGWLRSTSHAQELEARLGAERRSQAAAAAPAPLGGGQSGGRLPVAVNPAIVSLEPDEEGTTVRGGDRTPVQAVPPNVDLLVLTLRPGERDAAKRHAAELVDPAGRVHPLTDQLAQNADGFYSLGIPRQLLASGPNAIRVYATDGGRRALVGRYTFQV